jgi:hypothetical protein
VLPGRAADDLAARTLRCVDVSETDVFADRASALTDALADAPPDSERSFIMSVAGVRPPILDGESVKP